MYLTLFGDACFRASHSCTEKLCANQATLDLEFPDSGTNAAVLCPLTTATKVRVVLCSCGNLLNWKS